VAVVDEFHGLLVTAAVACHTLQPLAGN